MNTDQSITVQLSEEQASYLRTLLTDATNEGRRVEEEIDADEAEDWGGDYPDDIVDAAYGRAAIARSILDQLS